MFVEYAKASPEDILIRITVHNRGPGGGRRCTCCRRCGSATSGPGTATRDRPTLQQVAGDAGARRRPGDHPALGERYLYCEGDAPLLFTENETNTQRIFGVPNRTPVRQGRHQQLRRPRPARTRSTRSKTGTKAAAHYRVTVPAGGVAGRSGCALDDRARRRSPRATARRQAVRRPLRRRVRAAAQGGRRVLRRPSSRRRSTPTQANVMRQALAGMLWSKQFYHYDVDKWLEERGSDPFKATRKQSPRNDHWHHMYNGDVISMPDKWEYPWYAAWDLAFHVLALTLVDPDFGKQQLKLMLRERYMHPNGQIPAYEWNFGDVNPPVHAWSTIFTYRLEKAQTGEGDMDWLKSSFQKLLLNFTWWVNRKDRTGRNVFEGGFLGLDNIGVFDRSAPLPTGGYLEQADGTAWMALFCQNMLEIAAELAMTDPDYADMALKFVEHFLWIASSMTHAGRRHRACGTRRTASSTTCCGCPTAGPSGSRSARWSACCRCARPRCSTGSCWRSTRRSAERFRWFLECAARAARRDPRPARSPASPAAGWRRSSTRPSSAACWRRCSTRTSSSARTASARCRATTPSIPTSSTPAARSTASPTCRPSPTPACSAATRTGAGRSGCRSTP